MMTTTLVTCRGLSSLIYMLLSSRHGLGPSLIASIKHAKPPSVICPNCKRPHHTTELCVKPGRKMALTGKPLAARKPPIRTTQRTSRPRAHHQSPRALEAYHKRLSHSRFLAP